MDGRINILLGILDYNSSLGTGNHWWWKSVVGVLDVLEVEGVILDRLEVKLNVTARLSTSSWPHSSSPGTWHHYTNTRLLGTHSTQLYIYFHIPEIKHHHEWVDWWAVWGDQVPCSLLTDQIWGTRFRIYVPISGVWSGQGGWAVLVTNYLLRTSW